MNHFETILFFARKHLNFLVTNYSFELTEKHLAREYFITYRNKRVEIEFISEMTNLTLPTINFKCYGMSFNIKKLDPSKNLKKLVSENNKRTIPIMEKMISDYHKTKEFDQQRWNDEFENNVRKEIELYMIEIEKILKNNTKVLKGNILPFIFNKTVANNV